MPVLCDSSVEPSGLAEAPTWAPTCPAAPALVSTTTGCMRTGSMLAASGRVTRSLMPPGGNALMMVIACEGKVSCANPGPAASAVADAAVPMTKLRRSMCSFPSIAAGLSRLFYQRRKPRDHRMVRRAASETCGACVPLSLHAADVLDRIFNARGVGIPELREFRRIEVFDLLAEIGH